MFESLLLAASVWITPVAHASPPVHVDLPVAVGLDTWSARDEWSIPVYVASPADRKVPLLYSPEAWQQVASGRWRRSGNLPEVEGEIRRSARAAFPVSRHVYASTSASRWTLPPPAAAAPTDARGQAAFRVPAQATPASGPDGHMAVQQPDGTVLETYATVRLSSGEIVALSYSVVQAASLGDGAQQGQTASMLPCHLGLLDDEEVAQARIGHALAVTLPARLLAPAYRYPAAAFDRDALDPRNPYAGSIPMGARLALDPAVPLAELHLKTPEGRAIAQALQTFGMIVVDRGGEGISLRVRKNPARPSAALHRWHAGLQEDLARIFSHIVLPGGRAPGP